MEKELKVSRKIEEDLARFLQNNQDEYSELIEFKKLFDSKAIKENKYADNPLPADKKKILGKDLYNELEFILKEVYAINNRYVGKTIFDIKVELNTNPEVILLKNELKDITKKYLMSRISKVNTKDKTNLDKYKRIVMELPLYIFELAFIENSLNNFFLLDTFKFMSDTLNTELLGQKRDFNSSKQRIQANQLSDDDSLADSRRKLIDSMISNNSGLENLLFFKGYSFEKYTNSVDEIKDYLENLAEDIQEMKLFLFSDNIKQNYERIYIVKDRLSIAWSWRYKDNNIGSLSIFEHNGFMVNGYSVDVDVQGMFTEMDNKLLSTENIYTQLNNDVSYYQINLYILEEVHSYLYSLYEKIDTDTFLEEILNSNTIITEKDELKVLSVISKRLSSSDTTYDKENKSYGIIKNTKWNKFLKILIEKFDCTVNYQGKGDDIKIYRNNTKDTKIYRTSDPKTKKGEILVMTQKNILKKVGISVEEWILTTCTK